MTNNIKEITPEYIFTFLGERFNDEFLTLKDLPHPSTLKDMDKAVKRIVHAIRSKEKIMIIGDYDVDGVISTSVLRRFFAQIDVSVEWIIPNRFIDGYGLSTSLIPRVKHCDLIITVDNGISAVESAKKCKELGIDLIITDHHIVPDIAPDAYAIINQKQADCTFPYEEICGAQIAWYLCVALKKALSVTIDMKIYLEMVSVAIIADIMPLLHINRAMVQTGLRLLNQSNTPFIKAYIQNNNKNSLTAEDIAFGLAPLLNSAGRVDDASLASDFVCSTNIYDARARLSKLISFNEQRKLLEEQVTQEAIAKVRSEDRVIVVASEGWHEGVVGIAASRLAREFERPAIVLSQNGDICKGSGRSFNNCNLFGLVNSHRELLLKFGGHSAAIGLSMDINNLDTFRDMLQSSAKHLCNNEPYNDPDILGVMSFRYIDLDLHATIARYEPFGQSNAKPKFVTKGVEILAVQAMGAEKNHLRFTFGHDGVILSGVQFKTTEQYSIGERVDILYKISENSFRGDTTLQLMVEMVMR